MKWSEKDIALLKRLYPDKSIDKKDIVNRLNRTWDAIRWYAHNIGLELRTDINFWTSEDEEKLKVLAKNPYLTSFDIGKILNRNSGQIRAKIFSMCIKRPKKEKKSFDLDFYNIEDHLQN